MLSQTTINNVLSSAQVLNKNGLSSVGRALQKHAGRPKPFKSIKFSHRTGNQQGLDILNDILNSKNPIIQSAGNGGYRILMVQQVVVLDYQEMGYLMDLDNYNCLNYD